MTPGPFSLWGRTWTLVHWDGEPRDMQDGTPPGHTNPRSPLGRRR